VDIETFLLERYQSAFENDVDVNLTESGVHPLSVAELLDPAALGSVELGYGYTGGSPALRELVAALHPGAGPENVLITNGTAEANFLVAWHFGGPGREAAVLVPNYLQLWGVLEAFGTRLSPIALREQAGRWSLDLDGLGRRVGERTGLVAVCNPNNPTGAVLTENEMTAICRAAERSGAWLVSDEIYRGAERSGSPTATFWGRGERIVVTGGLAKAYGLPGLRIGWVVGPADLVQELWRYKDYTTIGPSPLSDRLAQVALAPDRRERILARTRDIIRAQYPVVERWLAARADVFEWIAPEAGAFVYPRYRLAIASGQLVERLRSDKSVLVVAGEHFGMGAYLRIGFGGAIARLESGLQRFGELLAELQPLAGAGPPR
jgi:aspartate/methionine/tyrosine aminotransferase